ncbi:hypothetical protein AKJ09_11410 [Labilithrix luteola]|uniref:Uncharacterized protein n=2 Tax=Labilithrix luteola TaxID=1391654 RepID=A0A0K1QGH5_9BACT|nr:hypothetical protein AKJ09_11410 [Labilithrix luteola]
MPDDDTTRHTRDAQVCQGLADAGASDLVDAGDTTEALEGCRIDRDGVGLTTKCKSAKAAGTDGVSCNTGDDCAPGFDCVEGDKGGSVCRRYCCAGTCETQVSQNSGTTFCDVQRLVDTAHKAPVCMPLKHCKLLEPGACVDNETCAIVTASGESGCVAIGTAQAGDSCEENHCGAGLTCVGQVGNRRCYQLCKVSSSTCAQGQTCKTTTLFKDPEYGLCQATSSAK